MRSARIALHSIASSLLTGTGFFLWLQYSPKSWADPGCGVQNWALLAATPVIAVGALAPGVHAYRKRAGSLAVVATIGVGVVLTLGACLAAFLLWFIHHMCGE